MKEIRVDLGDRSYTIFVQMGLLDKVGFLLPPASRVALVTDTNVEGLYAERVKYSIVKAGYDVCTITIPAGEDHKNRETLEFIYDKMLGLELDRAGLVVALGGGVVGDVAGFAAATYMRGIACAQIPTTLLAAIDSSIGGKTGINHPRGKNMIGAFHQPVVVIVDPATLRTLPLREIAGGMAEIIKHGVIRDAELFAYLEAHLEDIRALEPETIEHVIAVNCRIKADVVATDEREAGLRAILNYGHTLGHALEAATEYSRYRHGEAVAIGMNLEARIARAMGMVDDTFIERQTRLIEAFCLPVSPPDDIATERIIHLLRADKKARGGRVRFILPTKIGSVVISDDVTDDIIMAELKNT
ncbi:MAG: 3-dehydroquinate synthase [Planctomycetes bacterium]|nr:3-dehydroquinate synthase [Planctomycetota bacterium]